MKTSASIVFVAFVLTTSGQAFQIPLSVKQSSVVETSLAMAGTKPNNKRSSSSSKKGNPLEQFFKTISNDFKPFHGHGSLENDLDDQWQAQQEILKNRRNHHIDKEHLKKKYSDPEKVKFDGKVGDDQESSFGKNLSP